MKDAAPQTIYLADYTPFPWLIDDVSLTFDLAPNATRVTSRIAFRPNPDSAVGDFFLHGEHLKLINAAIDGQPVTPRVTDTGLTCAVPNGAFVWESEVEIAPAANTALEGLYMSSSMYCTQCEAEGFRRITYYPDRPDVMAVFTVRVQSALPVLLSNGDLVTQGAGFAEWHDPWPKPAYLFALVAGDLTATSGQFITCEGRDVALNIWVRPGDEDKCAFALKALKLSMKWDEDVYGRAYDLDIYNIVAVDDFNSGAMENKGLNIFNSSLVLASPETSTDRDFERIEAVIAHEYFHNWTGNRITCRDWFQLCLKEGLTVFRDQQFTGDMRSRAVKRIEDVILLRARQFREDNGPLAHPVRPDSFVEIDNFYTLTVYEKGAELIGMLKRLVGDDAYGRALDLYFARHDGDAATIEDWLAVFTESTGRDLAQFKRWYTQAGTPRITATDDFKSGTYTLHFKQETPPTPGQDTKLAQVIPIAVGLLDPSGAEVVATQILEMKDPVQSFVFTGLATRPIPSILRDFSAPVILTRGASQAERAVLLAHDSDPFNKWEAGRALARDALLGMINDAPSAQRAYLDGLASVLRDDSLDPAFRALVLTLPSEDDTAQALSDAGHTPDPLAIHHAHEALRVQIAQHLQDLLPRIYADHQIDGPYSPDAQAAGARSLGNAVLALLSRLDGGVQAAHQYAHADNMTQQLAALSCLLAVGKGTDQVQAFYDQWHDDRLVMDKWFALQVANASGASAAKVADDLTRHPAFVWTNPNRFRSVFGALAGNAAGFHDASGTSYALLADWMIKLDSANPQTTARMTAAFETWRRYSTERQAMMRSALERIGSAPDLSPNTREMVTRILG